MDVDVFLAGWEIECCRPPPGEGDRITWPLLWVDDPSGPGAVEVDWRAGPPVSGVLPLRRGALCAYWRGTDSDEVPARGCLWADLHGGLEAAPLVRGTVVSVRVVEQAYRRTGPRGYEPVHGAYLLRPVACSPRWFAGGPSDRDDPLPDVMRRESGVLVGLALDENPQSGRRSRSGRV